MQRETQEFPLYGVTDSEGMMYKIHSRRVELIGEFVMFYDDVVEDPHDIFYKPISVCKIT